MKKSTIRSVWPDLAQNCHFGLNLRIYNQFCEALFSVGKILKLPNLSNCLCQVSFSLAAKNWTNNQAGWSHCFRLTLLCAPVKRSSLSHCTGFSSLSLSCTYFFSLSLSLSLSLSCAYFVSLFLLYQFCLSLTLVPILSFSLCLCLSFYAFVSLSLINSYGFLCSHCCYFHTYLPPYLRLLLALLFGAMWSWTFGLLSYISEQ